MSVYIEDDKINIRGLVIEEPLRGDGELAPEKLLTEEDWEDIKGSFEIPAIDSILFAASRVKLFAPQRLSNFGIDGRLEEVKEELKMNKESNTRIYLHLAASAKQLYGLSTDNNEKEGLRRSTQDTTDISSFGRKLSFALLYPTEQVESYTTEDDWRRLKDYIKYFKDMVGGNSGYWVANLSTIAKILFPDRFSEINLTKGDLQRIYQEAADDHRKALWFDFIMLSWSLKTLTADEIKLTDNGIELINHPKPLFDIQPLPERRRF